MTIAALAVPSPPLARSPKSVSWTVETFHQASSHKIWGEGRRMILIRGELMEQGDMNPPHATALDLVGDELRRVFSAGWRVRSQTPLVLSLDTDPIPDYAVVAGSVRDFTTSHPTTASLVVEISDSTLFFDLTTKAELYATAKVPEYWVLDLEHRQLIVYSDPVELPEGLGATAYRTRLTLNESGSVSPLAKPDASVKVSELLP